MARNPFPQHLKYSFEKARVGMKYMQVVLLVILLHVMQLFWDWDAAGAGCSSSGL